MATLLAATRAPPVAAQGRPLPDLVATIYALDLDNGVLQVDAAVRNQGTAPYGGGDDVVVQSSDGVKRYLKLPEIPEGQEYRFNLTIRGAGASVDVGVEADPRGKVTELFEGNNRAERRTSRPADLLVAGLRVESPPTDREPAHLLAELRDQLRSVSGVEPTAVQVRVRAALRAVGGQPVEFLVEEQTVPDFTGIHLMPVDVRLPADARSRVGGVRTADVEVEVCVNPDLLVAELGEQCAQGQGCNNCGSVTLDDVLLPEAAQTEAERKAQARAEEAARAQAAAEQDRMLAAQQEAERAQADAEQARTLAAQQEAERAQADAERAKAQAAAERAQADAAERAKAQAAADAVARAQAEAAQMQLDAARQAAALEQAAERARQQARDQAAAQAEAAAQAQAAAQAEAAARAADRAEAAAQAAAAVQAEAAALAQPPNTEALTASARPVTPAAPPAPDLVVGGLRVERGVLGQPIEVRVEVVDLHRATSADGADLEVELVHPGWRSEEGLTGSVSRADLARDGRAELVLTGELRASAGRCGPSPGERTTEPVTLRVASVPGELDTRNNSRSLRLDLSCQPDEEAVGLGPMPDPALAAVEPYLVEIEGRTYLQLMAHLQNLGTPIRTDALLLDATVGERSWLPASWKAPLDGRRTLAEPIVEQPLSGLPPRRLTLCGLGGTSLPIDDLPSLARKGAAGRQVGTDNSVEVTVHLGTLPAIRQLTSGNDSLVLSVPLDRELRPVEETLCGPRPALLGAEARRVQWLDGAPGAPQAETVALGTSIQAERDSNGTTLLRGEIVQRAPGRVARVEYAWRRDGAWAGGGVVDVPANAPVTVMAHDGGDSAATWELVVDPDGLLPEQDRSDDAARLTLPGPG